MQEYGGFSMVSGQLPEHVYAGEMPTIPMSALCFHAI